MTRPKKKLKNNSQFFYLILLLQFTINVSAELSIIDDTGRSIKVTRPLHHIVSLAPHTTELLYAAGAGDKIVGAVRFSDFPDDAKLIERIGDTYKLDIERIVTLEPDLIIAWESGNSAVEIGQLLSLGYEIYISEPDSLLSIADTISKFGILAGTELAANNSRDDFIHKLKEIRSQYSGRNDISTFYQFWHQPIFTINGKHLISEIIELCGGVNVYADLDILSTQVGLESVLVKNPEVIIASGIGFERPKWLDDWQEWPAIKAVKNRQLYFIPPDIIQRHTPRVLLGAEMMCEYIDKARMTARN